MKLLPSLPRSRKAEELKSCDAVHVIFLSHWSWLSSCVATSDLFAVVLIMCAETATYALAFPSGGLLNLDLTKR